MSPIRLVIKINAPIKSHKACKYADIEKTCFRIICTSGNTDDGVNNPPWVDIIKAYLEASY